MRSFERYGERPEGMTRTEIREHFGAEQNSLPKSSGPLNVLQEHELVRMVVEQANHGRPAERWYSISGTPYTR